MQINESLSQGFVADSWMGEEDFMRLPLTSFRLPVRSIPNQNVIFQTKNLVTNDNEKRDKRETFKQTNGISHRESAM